VNSLLGQSLILVALAAAGFGAATGWLTGGRPSPSSLRLVRLAVYLFGAAMIGACLVMEVALVTHDFSVHYVAQVGSRSTPLYITIVSLWSALEGSILFWGFIVGLFAVVFTFSLRDRFVTHMPYALATILTVGAFFALLLSGPSDPFGRVFPVPTDGPGPNPLLQNHPLMIVHPPMLYLGYVGMILPFAVAVAALMRAELSEGWLRVLRRTTLVAWGFLGVGIVMGGWWAYEVLGWGGYWAWDPVENASFLPWLAATGYLHSTMVQERKRMLKAWTLSLVIAAFLLTILGTFMTRSGVFNSVHSFTQSAIGPMFLIFLAIVTVLSVLLLAARSHLLEPETRIGAIVSRETAFLANNVLLVTFTFTVFLGTVFPLVAEAIRGVKLSVGEPYFNRMAVPIGMMLVFLMGVGPVLPWGRADKRVWRDFVVPVAAAVVALIVVVAMGLREPLALATFSLCGFALAVTLRELALPFVSRFSSRKGSLWSFFAGTLGTQQRRVGGHLVHLSVIIIVASICASQLYKKTLDLSLSPGQSADIGPYKLTFLQTVARESSNKLSIVAKVDVGRDGKHVAMLEPTLNFYPTQREPVGSPYVATIDHRDLYLSLMSFERDGSHVALKAFVIPMVAYIWWSLPIFALGALISFWPRRRGRSALAPSAASGVTAS
jgi:cytochrome c-type biogenesis protein CcmF